MIRVGRVGEPGAINLGRPHCLGNPFVLGVHGDRDTVCDWYDQWFEERLREGEVLVLGSLKRLLVLSEQQDLVLGCYCAPRRCHCDTIRRFLLDTERHEMVRAAPFG